MEETRENISDFGDGTSRPIARVLYFYGVLRDFGADIARMLGIETPILPDWYIS